MLLPSRLFLALHPSTINCDCPTEMPMVCAPATCALACWQITLNAEAAIKTSPHFAFMTLFPVKKQVDSRTTSCNNATTPLALLARGALGDTLEQSPTRRSPI